MSPVIARMCNASFEQCTLPAAKQKMAVTRPLYARNHRSELLSANIQSQFRIEDDRENG